MKRVVKRVSTRNERGQLTIEAILIMCIMTAIALTFVKTVQSNQLIAGIVEGPWKMVEGMIENGVWESADKGKPHHPSMLARHSSNIGDEVPEN